jgi:arylsulfatase
MWTFVPAQEYIKKFIGTIEGYPFQEGSSLNAAGINYQSLRAASAMERLKKIETMSRPGN